MNMTQIVYMILLKNWFKKTENQEEANCYLLNTCHIRDKAKEKFIMKLGE